MAKTELSQLSDDATIWIFGIDPVVEGPPRDALLRNVDAFLEQWVAHGVPVTAARELREGRFLVVAAEANSETSGCSIDKLFSLVRALESHLHVAMLDANRIFFRDSLGAVVSSTRSEFGAVADASTIVFDVTAGRLGDFRSGSWERPARDSWHAQLLEATA